MKENRRMRFVLLLAALVGHVLAGASSAKTPPACHECAASVRAVRTVQ